MSFIPKIFSEDRNAKRKNTGGVCIYYSDMEKEKKTGFVKTFCTLVGTVVGAGFVSGAELVRFFPENGFASYAYLAAILFFFGFALLFACGRRFGGFEGLMQAAFGRLAPAVRALVLVCSLIICAGMLAGLDSVMYEGFSVPKYLPVLSVTVLVAVYFLCDKGIGAIGVVNACLVPAILLFVAWLACGELNFGGEYSTEESFRNMTDVFLYAGMNVFLAAPIACDLGMRAGKAGTCACFGASAVIGVSIAVILATIFAAAGISADVPLLSAIGGGVAGKLFSAVSAFGIVTTLFSAYYPLHERARISSHPRTGRIVACVAAFGLSRMGLRAIVSNIYPLLGGAGLIFLAACLFAVFKAVYRQTVYVKVKKCRVRSSQKMLKNIV